MPYTERRRASRHLVAVPCQIEQLSDRSKVTAHVIELSTSGALVACIGVAGTVRLDLRTRGGGLSLVGEVVRQEPGRTAVRFTGLSAADRRSIAAISGAPATVAA